MCNGRYLGLPQACARLLEDRRGVVAAMTAMLVVPLVLAIGLAIDASRMFLVRAKLSQAVDAAALAAGQALDAAAVTADARRIFAINYPEAYLGAGVDLPEVNYDEDTGQVEVIARTALPTMFMQLANVETLDLEARALVVREQRGMELALVLDVTGSMCEPGYYQSCTTRPKIAALKQAAKDLLDIVYGPNDTGEDLYVAVVPFSERVKVGNSQRTRAWTTSASTSWNGCTDQRSGDYAFDDTPPSTSSTKFPRVQKIPYTNGNGNPDEVTPFCPEPANTVLPLTASKATVRNKISSLVAQGSTRIDIGAGWGWRVFSERWQGSWGVAGLPLNDDEDPVKAIVIMTDGKNDVPDELPNAMEEEMVEQADEDLVSTCEAMRAAGYEVFTVPFQAPPQGEAVLLACAGSADRYFATHSAADLRRAFRQIGGRLSALRLAE